MKSRHLLATGVTILGVITLWLFASMRQEDQTVELSRRWVGEQWDITRRCVIGTPVGRSLSVTEKSDRLAAMAVEAVVAASESDAPPDLDALWPARCVPLFRRLHVSPEVTGVDLSTPVSQLEVLVGRVIELDDIARTVANARELGALVDALDHGMPPGAEYDPTHFEGPHTDPRPIEESFDTTLRVAARPFLSTSAGGRPLYDELDGERLSGGERFVRETPDAQEELDAQGLAFPRFWGGGIAWLVVGEPSIRAGERTIALPMEEAPTAWAPCAGDAFLVGSGDAVHFVREQSTRADPEHRVASLVRPSPPVSNVSWACDAQTAIIAWPHETHEGRWIGSRCDVDGCRALPPLEAPGDVQVAVGAGRTLAVGRGRRTDLHLWRELLTDAWSAPTPVPYGVPSVDPQGLAIAAGDWRWVLSQDERDR